MFLLSSFKSTVSQVCIKRIDRNDPMFIRKFVNFPPTYNMFSVYLFHCMSVEIICKGII